VEAITPYILGEVRRICTNPKSRDGIVQGNLKIAEDRILSYLLLLIVGDRRGRPVQWQTHWVPSTVFYFEAEDENRVLAFQRRRWLNGTTCGYAWLLLHPKLWSGMFSWVFTGSLPRLMPWAVFALSVTQLLIFFMVFIMPAFLAATGHLAIMGVFALVQMWGSPVNEQAVQAVDILFWIIYGGSFLVHVYQARWGSTKYNTLVWRIRMVSNALLMVLNVVVMLAMFAMSLLAPTTLADQITARNVSGMLRLRCASGGCCCASGG
jgi:cellulose synthase/poly-beta-1,6-N-acetylglucosamine synthase-like glycosyltransferase